MRHLLSFSLLLIGIALVGQGTLRESLKISSKILGKDVKYSIYLPPGFGEANRKYPVLFLLHGYTDDETGWTQFGEIEAIANEQMMTNQATPMVIAMPDAGIDWYINSYDGKTRYEDFFMEEFIPFIESTYRGRGAAEFRAVAGLSMGGYGSMLYAVKHPEAFAAVAPLSARVWTDDEIMDIPMNDWNTYFGFIHGPNIAGDDRLSEHVLENTILNVLKSTPVDDLKKVKYYIDCGDDDFLIEGNMALHAEMKKMDIPHEFRVRDGGHSWTYWRTAMPEVLKFVTASFHR